MKRLVLVGLVVLAGCQTKTVEELSYSERKALASQIQQRCYDQGVKANTPEFTDCARVEVQREAATRRRAAAVEDAWRASDSGPTTCHTFGNTVRCF